MTQLNDNYKEPKVSAGDLQSHMDSVEREQRIEKGAGLKNYKK